MSAINTLIKDILEVPIIVTTKRGNGKTTMVKALVKQLKETYPDIIIKVFDNSLQWLENAPLKYKQIVTLQAIDNNQIENIGDCVYELKLDISDMITFLATIVKSDLDERHNLGLNFGLDVLKAQPFIVYIVEETDTIFSSNSLRSNTESAKILRYFLSVGRNLNTGLIGISTNSSGEVSPTLRRKASYLVGSVNSLSDITDIRKREGWGFIEAVQDLGKYEYLYSGDSSQVIKLAQVPSFTNPSLYTPKTHKPKVIVTQYRGGIGEDLGEKPSLIKRLTIIAQLMPFIAIALGILPAILKFYS